MEIKVKAPRVNTFVDLGLLLFVLKTGFDVSGILPHNTIVDNIIIVVGLGAFVISVLQQNYSANTLFKYAMVTALSLCSTLASGQSVIIITVITILAIRQLNFTTVIRKLRIWSTWFLCVHSICFALLYFMGQTQLFSTDGQGRVRASFGFGHANSFSIYVFNIILMWTWEKYDELSWKNVFAVAVIDTVLFQLTDSKTFYFCALVFLLLLMVIRCKKLPVGWIIEAAKLIFPTLSLLFLSAYGLLLKGNLLTRTLDKALTGRITLGAYALQKYGVSFMGQKLNFGSMTWTPEWQLNYFTLDCTYTSLWINIGWLWIIILIGCFFLIAQKGSIKTSVFIIMWALYAISEVHGLDAYLCFPILMISTLLDNKYKRESSKR